MGIRQNGFGTRTEVEVITRIPMASNLVGERVAKRAVDIDRMQRIDTIMVMVESDTRGVRTQEEMITDETGVVRAEEGERQNGSTKHAQIGRRRATPSMSRASIRRTATCFRPLRIKYQEINSLPEFPVL